MTRYKVMARVEETEPHKQNGEEKFRWVCVRHDVPRGTAEALMVEAAQRGFRPELSGMPGDKGSLFYPSHRIALVEVVSEDMEVK